MPELKKRCTSCERDLPAEEFSIRSDTGKRYSQCRGCKNTKGMAYYKNNVRRHAVTVRRRYETFGRFMRYGLTADQYDAVLAAQGGKCALCQAEKPGGKGKWHIDHNHTATAHRGFPRKGFNQCEAKHVRGLLCHKCNVNLGHYEKLLVRVGLERIQAYLVPPDGDAVDAHKRQPQTDSCATASI